MMNHEVENDLVDLEANKNSQPEVIVEPLSDFVGQARRFIDETNEKDIILPSIVLKRKVQSSSRVLVILCLEGCLQLFCITGK